MNDLSNQLPHYQAELSGLINEHISAAYEKLAKKQGELFLQRQEAIYEEHMRGRVPMWLFALRDKEPAPLAKWLRENDYHYDVFPVTNVPGWQCRRIRKGTETIAVHFYRIALK